MDDEVRQIMAVAKAIGYELHAVATLCQSVGLAVWFVGAVAIVTAGREPLMFGWFPIAMLLMIPVVMLELKLREVEGSNPELFGGDNMLRVRSRLNRNSVLAASLREIRGGSRLLWLATPARQVLWGAAVATVGWYAFFGPGSS